MDHRGVAEALDDLAVVALGDPPGGDLERHRDVGGAVVADALRERREADEVAEQDVCGADGSMPRGRDAGVNDVQPGDRDRVSRRARRR
ncbi:MAG TPA: hypothetical protein VHZ31_05820 [Solirubrobacteraceae bacterium]|nr:hypothetical protein [Solirubrobacteraceae bacterium]